MAATTRQIAARAHVSASTVSRVLNGFPRVEDSTRALVLQAAQDMGMLLPANLKAPRQGRTALLLQRDTGQPNEPAMSIAARGFEYAVSSGMQPVFEKHGITMRLQRTRMDIGEAEMYARDPAVSGLVLMGGIQDPAFVRAVQASDIPFIVIGSHMYPLDVNCVMPDYLNGTRQAVEHLARAGRRCIGLVNGPGTTTSSAEKYQGYRLGLTLSGLTFDPTLVIASDFDAEAGYQQTRDLLQDQPIVDAIVFGMDDQALGGMRAIRESGRRIPNDVAVVGFYDHDVARFTEPPLTSVRIDWPSLGAVAASRLRMLMDAPDEQTWCVVKPTELVVRRSSEASDQTIHN